MKQLKPRIAVFEKGVIGGGKLGYGIPMLRDLFANMSKDFDVVVYSFSSVDESNVLPDVKVRQIRLGIPLVLRSVLLSLRFVIDQFISNYQIIFAVSISPAGHWAVRLGSLFRINVVLQLIGPEAASMPDCNGGDLDNPALKKITLNACRKATRLIVLGEFQKRVAQNSLPFERRIDLVPLRIDATKFEFKRRPISFPVQFIHIAYYSKVKDQNTMFASFAEISKKIDCHLTVIGGGFDSPEAQSIIDQLEIAHKITFKGQLDQSQIPRQFENMHILIHASRFEGSCAVVQEAMASGVAVCGTPVGILGDLGDDFGVIVRPQDSADLTAKILRLVSDPVSFDQITENAYKYIINHEAAWSYLQHKKYFKELLAKRRSLQQDWIQTTVL